MMYDYDIQRIKIEGEKEEDFLVYIKEMSYRDFTRFSEKDLSGKADIILKYEIIKDYSFLDRAFSIPLLKDSFQEYINRDNHTFWDYIFALIVNYTTQKINKAYKMLDSDREEYSLYIRDEESLLPDINNEDGLLGDSPLYLALSISDQSSISIDDILKMPYSRVILLNNYHFIKNASETLVRQKSEEEIEKSRRK